MTHITLGTVEYGVQYASVSLIYLIRFVFTKYMHIQSFERICMLTLYLSISHME